MEYVCSRQGNPAEMTGGSEDAYVVEAAVKIHRAKKHHPYPALALALALIKLFIFTLHADAHPS